MNGKQSILAALERRSSPRPAASLLSGGCWTLNRLGHSLESVLDRPERIVQAVLQTHEAIRSDMVWVGSGFHNLAIEALGGQLKYRAMGSPDVRSPILQRPDEVARLDLALIDRYPRIANQHTAIAKVHHCVGSHVLVGSSQWGPFTLAGHLLGVESLMRSIYRNPEALPQLLEFSSELCVRYLKRFIDHGAELVSVAEPTGSGDLISAAQFRRFAFPYVSQVVRELHHAGAKVCLHICGNITELLPLLPETGVDLVSFDYKVNLAKARDTLAGKVAFAGNVNPVLILHRSPEEVASLANDALEVAGRTPGYVLMPGCDIPPSVPLENVVALLEAGRNWAGRQTP